MPDIFTAESSPNQDLPQPLDENATKSQPAVSTNFVNHDLGLDPAPTVQEVLTNEKSRKKLRHHTHDPLTSFSAYPDPDKLNFETKDDTEAIALFLRQHPIVNIPWIFISFLLIFAPLILTAVPALAFLPERFQIITILIWYLLTSAYILERFLNWYFNIYIVTTERIVDIDFQNITYKRLASADIDRVQNVSFTVGGFFGTMFNFGNVLIQTAAEIPEFIFESVANPNEVVDIIQNLQMEEEKEKFGQK